MDAEGKPYQYVAIRHDITLEKEIESQLEQKVHIVEQDYQLIIESVKDYAIFMLDPSGYVKSWNKGAERIKGYKAEEIIGHHFSIFFANDDIWRGKPEYSLRVAEMEGRYEEEGWRIRKDGSKFWANIVTTSIRNEGNDKGELLGYVKVVRDITERKTLENQIQVATEKAGTLEEANQKKNMFMAMMSHELRTPLTSIIGFSQLLEAEQGGILTDKQKKYIHNVQVAGNHLLEIINDVLDMAKMEGGSFKLYPRILDIESLVNSLKNILAVQAASKSIHLAFDIQPGLDGMEGDPVRIRQILLNLLNNAIKFNHENGEVNIHLFKTEDQQWVVCEVQDTGIGIPKNKIPNLFTEFYQVDSSAIRKNGGTGLGLAITKKLVELHGGTIEVKSEEGVGSTFTFKIPTNSTSL